jgi:tripartite-type tricarboxylate transporter receptor subunit TctC
MRLSRRRFLQLTAAGAALPPASRAAWAQAYPSKPVRMILPFAPGTSNDVIARLIGPPLTTRLGQPVVIDNRPGGGTVIGTKAAMSAAPDGHTLLVASSNVLIISQTSNENISYDPIKDFVPVATIASTSWVLLVSAAVSAKSVAELIALAKANPGKLSIGFGQGTGPQLVGELFKSVANIDLLGVPYRGGSQVITDLLGGRLQVYFGTAANTLPLIHAGKLRALAVTSETRDPVFPDSPTMKEAGLPDLTLSSTIGMLVPARTPADIVDRLYREVLEVTKTEAVRQSIAKAGYEVGVKSPAEFAAQLAREKGIWLPIAQKIGFKIN